MYGADSADKYEPLTSEEKEEMSDDEIEDWENKIKDALLRNDSTLGNIKDTMSQYMQKGIQINGQTYYLSSFGINTAGYFDSTYKDRYALHIDGDSDDEYSSQNDDKLKTMIAQDPELVSKFFQQLTNDLYSQMQKMMSKTSLSSAMTFYNDVELKNEYDDYSDKITAQEEKITALEDKYYSKFSAMETALAKLSSKSSAISGLLGT
jgi:flagellar hook-associated protein 2